eukprot:CAMPEP_0119487048 /NCGR_PEP_ID=MMETSP1344-20130328/13251_1 /TAXON_ID=236787 /ORGANISM="Florenciella parvula, Strain CCMP2471" /LENGTH=61 /DNA_ID=CAMNT_0007521859 /DNA_START=59 /DNA_END=241 /DNA_ORIENTATION=-
MCTTSNRSRFTRSSSLRRVHVMPSHMVTSFIRSRMSCLIRRLNPSLSLFPSFLGVFIASPP